MREEDARIRGIGALTSREITTIAQESCAPLLDYLMKRCSTWTQRWIVDKLRKRQKKEVNEKG